MECLTARLQECVCAVLTGNCGRGPQLALKGQEALVGTPLQDTELSQGGVLVPGPGREALCSFLLSFTFFFQP